MSVLLLERKRTGSGSPQLAPRTLAGGSMSPKSRLVCALPAPPMKARFVLTIPFVYLGLLPFLLLDGFLALYQTICFGAWEVPRVDRADYLLFDRAHLPHLDWHQRVNCRYCSYANGLAACFREVAARSEQYWCPVQHRTFPPAPHSRYHRFVPYGDAHAYQSAVDKLSTDFSDLKQFKEK
jgi:hypothetical protein